MDYREIEWDMAGISWELEGKKIAEPLIGRADTIFGK